MYDGYQVLRFENNYKSKDLYLIGNEMNNRVRTSYLFLFSSIKFILSFISA